MAISGLFTLAWTTSVMFQVVGYQRELTERLTAPSKSASVPRQAGAGGMTIQFDSESEHQKSRAILMNKRRVWCRTPGARPPGVWTQPFRAGLTFSGRPSGPGLQTPLSHVHSSLHLPQARQAPRQAGAGGAKRWTKEERGVSIGIGPRHAPWQAKARRGRLRLDPFNLCGRRFRRFDL